MIQTFISFDSGKSWSNIKNESNVRINIHMTSSLINSGIYPMESSLIGGIIANGSEGNHLTFPSKNDITNEFIFQYDLMKTFISHDFGLTFSKVFLINLIIKKN